LPYLSQVLHEHELATYAHALAKELQAFGPMPTGDVLVMLRAWRLTEIEAEDVLVYALGYDILHGAASGTIRAGKPPPKLE
jgi:hypothetical protein